MTKPQDNVIILIIVWLHIIGISTYNFQPFLVGDFVTHFGFSDNTAGLVITANMLGVCLGLFLAVLRIHLWGTRRTIITALLLVTAGNLLSVFTDSFFWMATVRLLTGFGEGFAMAGAISMVGRFAHPDRIFAMAMIGMSLYGVAGLLLVPDIIGRWGLNGLFLIIAAISFASLAILGFLPGRIASHEHGQFGGWPQNIGAPAILVLLSLMLVYTGVNGVWPYYERIGNSIGIGAEGIGAALSAGLFASMVGALLAAALRDRYGRYLPMSAGVLLAAISSGVLYFTSSYPAYVLSVTMLFGSTGFCVPYFLGTLVHFDESGKLPIIGQLTIFVGNFAGPAVAAVLVTSGDYSGAIVAVAFFFLLSLALISIIRRQLA